MLNNEKVFYKFETGEIKTFREWCETVSQAEFEEFGVENTKENAQEIIKTYIIGEHLVSGRIDNDGEFVPDEARFY